MIYGWVKHCCRAVPFAWTGSMTVWLDNSVRFCICCVFMCLCMCEYVCARLYSYHASLRVILNVCWSSRSILYVFVHTLLVRCTIRKCIHIAGTRSGCVRVLVDAFGENIRMWLWTFACIFASETASFEQDKLTATWKEVNCNIYWNLNRVRYERLRPHTGRAFGFRLGLGFRV